MGSEREGSGQSIADSAMGSCFQVSADRVDSLAQAHQSATSRMSPAHGVPLPD